VRCAWGTGDAMREYHDVEWGRPVTDEAGLFERLCLEAFQSGLSWSTILAKREAFRRAFAGFDPEAVARFGARDTERLMRDASIVRNRAKIEAAIANAAAVVALRDAELPFPVLVWSFAPTAAQAPKTDGDIPAVIPESQALAKALKRHGFRFVGPTTAYALMQACGLVNDHVAACHVRAEVESERAAAREQLAAAERRHDPARNPAHS
jgi:DNA-3-methyladenine glycosylase I